MMNNNQNLMTGFNRPHQQQPAISGGSSVSQGSNHTSSGQETSEESGDDCTPHPPVLSAGHLKRLSPESGDKVNNDEHKIPKQKKKRDPNGPQKPVSAYALFFRDTQAAIKGQNPNASFGEVSKIVASMWDSLDADHKNIYKKKTEVAKKEYLKALGGYRSSLVSKQPMPQQSTNMKQDNSTASHNMPRPVPTSLSSASMMNQPQHIAASHRVNNEMATHHHNHQPIVSAQIHEQSISQSPPLQQHNTPTTFSQNAMVTQVTTTTQGSNSPPQITPTTTLQSGAWTGDSTTTTSVPSRSDTPSPTELTTSGNSRTCLRSGCLNPPVESPDWDAEYCSNECVITHCRNVFTEWVASRQTPNIYTSVN